jgi:signal transduction histidine kinase
VPLQTQTTTILLIEDDEEDYILLQRLLRKIPYARYKLLWESSPETGLTRMLRGKHDLCMLDYRLGAQNGIEMIKAARRQGYSLPIILLTGASESEIDIQALQAGADDYIAKEQLQGELLYRMIRYAIERKKAEHERENLLREQIASRELEAKRNEFISMVVHELKTPLTSLKSCAQLLQRRSARAGNEQMTQLTTRMDAQINRLTGLIDDFLDVTRITAGKLQFREEFFSFDELVVEIVEELQTITEQHKLIIEGESNETVWGDRMRVGQVITNLLTNAMKYAPDTDRVLVKIATDTDKVTLRVQDFGPGIPKELQTKVFDPFYRIEGKEQTSASGLGLGLHIAAEIIRRQEGEIWIESEEGKGAEVCFTLPLNRKQQPAQPQREPVAAEQKE